MKQKIYTLLLLVMALLCVGTTTARAVPEVTSVFTYKATDDLSENFENAFGKEFSVTCGTWEDADTPVTVTVSGNVTSIVDYAFCECCDLTAISLPSSVTSIGEGAFADCDELITVTLPSELTSIGKSAFSGCTSLSDITLPSKLTSIGDGAFSNCTSLSDITLPSSVTSIGEGAFADCDELITVTLPSELTSIGESAFAGCTSLSDITLPSKLTSIGNYAFYECSKLTAISLPSKLTSIGDYAFYECSKLTAISLPSKLTSIGDYAFAYCEKLASVTCEGNTPAELGDDVFYYDAALTAIYVPAPQMQAYKSAWSDYASLIQSGPLYIVYTSSTKLTETTDASAAGLHTNAFGSLTIEDHDYANGVGTITFSGNVTTIGENAFSGCAGLSDIIFPSTTESFGKNAFAGTGFTTVTIPGSVTSIGEGAYSGCVSLTSVTCEGSTPATLGTGAFANCSALIAIYVPADQVQAYKTAWSEYASLVQADPRTLITYTASKKLTELTYQDEYPDEGGCLCTDAFDAAVVSHTFADGIGTIVFDRAVTTIGYYAFSLCADLTSITFPGGITSIRYEAFVGCTGLESVVIPQTVKDFSPLAFRNCTGLTSISVEEGNTVYDSRGGCNAIIETATNTLIFGVKTTSIPSSVTSIGDYAFAGRTDLEEISLPSNLTSIGSYAFSGCTRLSTVTLPSRLTSIANDAFQVCTSLTSVTCEGNTPAELRDNIFVNCSALTAIYVPLGSVQAYKSAWSDYADLIQLSPLIIAYTASAKLTETTEASIAGLHTNAFGGLTVVSHDFADGAGTITFSDNVTTIGENAFSGCAGLSDINIPSTVKSLGKNAFAGTGFTTLTIPSNVTSIGEGAYSGCESLTSVTCEGSTPATLGTGAFANCSVLTAIYVPAAQVQAYKTAWPEYADLIQTDSRCVITYTAITRLSISSDSFGKGLSLLSHDFAEGTGTITFSGKVTTIGDMAFYGCNTLQTITIPSSVTSIGNSAFRNCTSLQTITIPSGVTSIEVCAFMFCNSLQTITIPSGVTSIGVNAFSNCSNLNTVTISSGVTSIGEGAFASCSNLQTVTIPSSVTSIGKSAFSGCFNLQTITIPSGVTSIGENAFGGCTRTPKLEFQSIPQLAGSGVFSGCMSLEDITLALTDDSYVYTGSNEYFPSLTAAPTYTRSIAATSNWGTVVLPFEAESDAQVQLYELTAVANGAMTFSPVATVAANTPCVFRKKVADATSVTFTATSAAISPASPSEPAAVDGLAIRGTYALQEEQTGMYFIAQDKFWYAESPITISPFRAWFEGTLPSQASLRIEVADNAEDLQLIEREDGTLYMVNGKCHDLMGRQIGEGRTGLQVKDGRVIMVK